MSHHFEIGLSICFLQFISLIFLCTLQQEPSSKFIFCIKKKEIDQSHLSIPFLVLSCRNQGIPTSMDILFSMYRSFFSSSPLYHT